MNLIDEFKNDVAGLSLLKDWLGEGGNPVSQSVADRRAISCRLGWGGGTCPRNKEPNWWERIKSAIADTIISQLEIKQKLNLHASGEYELDMCAACGCCLKLKVWTPLEHIQAHTTREQLAKMTDFCWIKKELSL
jgi:hypothetical protein